MSEKYKKARGRARRATQTPACRKKRGRFSLRLRSRLFWERAFGKTHGVGWVCRTGTTNSITRYRGVTESSADARGPLSRTAQGAAHKARFVPSLPHQRAPATPANHGAQLNDHWASACATTIAAIMTATGWQPHLKGNCG